MSNYFKHKMRTKNPIEIVGWVLLAIIGFTALVLLFGFIITWLWNWLMPELFDLPLITFWQGMGLFLLSKIFFGGFSGGGNKSSHKKSEKFRNDSACEENKSGKNEFSKWKHYDKFWDQEGKAAFDAYVANRTKKSNEEE